MRTLTSARHAARALGRLTVSMRVRLTLWYLAILALVFLVFGAIIVTEVRQSEEAAQHAVLTKIAQQIASSYSPADGLLHATIEVSGKADVNASQPRVAQTFLLPAQGVALFVDPRGRVIQTIGPLATASVAQLQQSLLAGGEKSLSNTPAGAASLSHAAGVFDDVWLPMDPLVDSPKGGAKQAEYITYSTDVISQGRLVGTLLVGVPNAIDQTAQAALPALLVAGPITLLVAALGGYWLASRALRPVRLITRAAQRISETDLSARLRLSQRDELGELAATFDHMLARLEAAFQRQRQFTADASHELRTPLTIINLEVTRALAQRRTPEEYEQALGVIQAENLAMSRLVGDLLTLARADASQTSLRLTRLDLSDVALEAVERLAPLARERGVSLVVEALPETPLLGDRAALAQALTNLIENGVKYTAGVGSRVRVTTCYESTRAGAWAVARIADDGPGIAPEHLPQLFDRFYRVDAARASADPTGLADPADGEASGVAPRDGHGLGLAIAQWAARAHGGELAVESAEGVGSIFVLRLPALASVDSVVDAGAPPDRR